MPAIFKGIIPGKRVASVDLSADPSILQMNGKENRPDSHGITKSTKSKDNDKTKASRKPSVFHANDIDSEAVVMSQAFDKLLDDLQIPSTLRPKLDTMDASVKAAMLRSSRTLALPPSALAVSPPSTPKSLRRTRSSDTLDSPRPPLSLAYEFPTPPQTAGRAYTDTMGPPLAPFMESSTSGANSLGHQRGASLDLPRSGSQIHLPLPSKSDISTGKVSKGKSTGKDMSPAVLCSLLASTSTMQLEVDTVKKLRLLLRNESASWSEEFFRHGGYNALLTRLNEILEVEWREEQHGDQILHELLRCFKGFSTSAIGCFALRSSFPTPFVQLVSLLYSDKKPGDISTRQLIVDLLLLLFELYPPSSLPSSSSSSSSSSAAPRPRRREIWEHEDEVRPQVEGLITLPGPHKSTFALLRALLLTPAPAPSEAPATPVQPHEFIESLHVPRIYKTYLQELSDVCRDYFWVFCHPNNTIWNLEDTDEARVEKPRAPGGMTGGVEFEAMGYLTAHFKLVNAIAKAAADLKLPMEHEHSAYRFHKDLFASGLERILLVSRKASTAYYPTLHLEVARYVAFAVKARFELPWTMSRIIGSPPSAMCKPGRGSKTREGGSRSAGNTPTKRNGAGSTHGGPRLPMPTKTEPLKF